MYISVNISVAMELVHIIQIRFKTKRLRGEYCKTSNLQFPDFREAVFI